MSGTILCLTDDNFKEKVLDTINLSNNRFFLVDFWAEWCNPCKAMSYILDEIAIEFGSKLTVAKLNIDDNPTITKSYNIRSIPSLLLIRNGVVVSSKIGLLSKQQLQEFLNTHI